jgi:hypothetical protein
VKPSRIAARSGRQRKLLVKALARLAWFRVALLVLPVPALLRRIERRSGVARADFTPREAAWAVHAVARRLPGTHCLPRALALHELLRRSGFASELRIGVARAGTGIAAHAWVECAGEGLESESALRSYAPFGTLPR